MISNFVNDVNDGIALLIDGQGNEMTAHFSLGKMRKFPEEVKSAQDPEYVKLKVTYNEILSKLEYEPVQESSNLLV